MQILTGIEKLDESLICATELRTINICKADVTEKSHNSININTENEKTENNNNNNECNNNIESNNDKSM